LAGVGWSAANGTARPWAARKPSLWRGKGRLRWSRARADATGMRAEPQYTTTYKSPAITINNKNINFTTGALSKKQLF